MRKSIVFVLFIMITFLPRLASAQSELIPSLPGRIAYIGADGNVYVLNPQNNQVDALTDDAGEAIHYRWPTWSTDGRLAYFVTKASGTRIETDVFISPTGAEAGKMVYQGSDEAFTYAYWSPQDCNDGADCRELAVLLSNVIGEDFSVKLIRNGVADSVDSLAGTGAPFYYSWSPDGHRMLWQRNNSSIDIYDAGDNQVLNTLPQQPGFFQAPAWSPIDDRWLFGVLGGDQRSTDLIIVGNDETQTLASELSGLVSFSWSPDGNNVAYVENGGALFVVDSKSGTTVVRSPVSGVYAFFWSPDSKKIAYITLATAASTFSASADQGGKMAAMVQNTTGIAWSVMDVSSGETHRYGAFIPTDEMLYMLSFFDQFSQSHRIWSPDSRYLIYGEIAPDRRQVVSLLDTSQIDTVPFTIEEGVVGVWSFN